MTDIAILWDEARWRGDWSLAAGDVGLGNDIEAAVLVSLFTDRRAPVDSVPPDGSRDRRGWWGDTYTGSQIGSRLWLLDRAKKTSAAGLLVQAQRYCAEALQWLVDDGIAATVDVQTSWIDAGAMAILVTVRPPGGGALTVTYGLQWPAFQQSSASG